MYLADVHTRPLSSFSFLFSQSLKKYKYIYTMLHVSIFIKNPLHAFYYIYTLVYTYFWCSVSFPIWTTYNTAEKIVHT